MAADGWSDAHAAVVEPFLEGRVAAVRRRIWLRKAASIVLGSLAVLGLVLGFDRLVRSSNDELWSTSTRMLWVGAALYGVGLVIAGIGWFRTVRRGVDTSLVTPAAFLSRSDRAWLRATIAFGEDVSSDRRPVVADAARRMADRAATIPSFVGLLVTYLATMIVVPTLSIVVTFAALVCFMVTRVVSYRLWADRGQRWLERNA